MKILVTGAAGFLGNYVVDELLGRDYEVISFDRMLSNTPRIDVEHVFGDIRDSTQITESMAHADGWIHLAGVLGTAETIANPRPAAETNVLGGLNVLEGAVQYDLPGVVICVGNHYMDNTYAITKTTVERFCNMYRDERDLNVSKMRALNAYGPRQTVAHPYGSSKVRKIMPSFICRGLSGDPIQVYGDGSQIMDMVYAADVARTLVDTLEYNFKNGPIKETLECGTGRPTTVLQIANAVRDAIYQSHVDNNKTYFGEIVIENLPMRAGEPEKSIVLAKTETLNVLGYGYASNFTTLEQALPSTIRYFNRYLGLA